MPIDTFLPAIQNIASTARTEAKLEHELNNVFKNLLAEYDIVYDPAINESLKYQGISKSSSSRPDSLFGHVIMDFKSPGILSNPQGTEQSKKQIEKYLEEANKQDRFTQAKWAGILCDGQHLVFCHSADNQWRWSPTYQITKASLVTLVQTYRALERYPLTPELLCQYFGKESTVAKNLIPLLVNQLSAQTSERTNMLFREWKRLFEQASSYDFSQLPSLKKWATHNQIVTSDASVILFAMHTYYSIIVKLLAVEILQSATSVTSSEVITEITNAVTHEGVFTAFEQLENGRLYRNYRISNFLEGDFFAWYLNEQTPELANALVDAAHTFTNFEPATAKLKPELVRDLLKEFYSGILDGDIRHDLGEYYTPDWLAQYLLQQVDYRGEPGTVLVDPACGSGTFLMEAITILRRNCENQGFSPEDTLSAILKGVRGIDLNPLAVISSRVNYLLAISDLVFALGEAIEIPIYLADAINIPEEKAGGIFVHTLDTEVGEIVLEVPKILVTGQVFGKVLLKCEDDINSNHTVDQFITNLNNLVDVSEFLDPVTTALMRKFYLSIQGLHNRRPPWDSIWCRIVKNNFSPQGFSQVDFIVGNPPWVRWSRLPTLYRKRVKKFCDRYGLVSGKGYTGGIETDISTVLTYSAVDHWLKIGGRVGVLITWTVFKSVSARGFRVGCLPDLSGLRMDRIEDLSHIQAFSDATNATGLMVGTKVPSYVQAQFEQIPFLEWRAKPNRIPTDLSLEQVIKKVNIIHGEASPVNEFGSPLFTGSREDLEHVKGICGVSPYLKLAHRGVINDMARVYWVKVNQLSLDNERAMIRTLRTDELTKAREVRPTNGAWVESDLLYPLLRGRDIGRYCYQTDGWHQLIPNAHYSDISTEEIFSSKYPTGYDYLMQYRSLLEKRSTYIRYLRQFPPYVVTCIGDYSFLPYKVLWPEQQDPAKFRSCVIHETGEDDLLSRKLIVPDHKVYFIGTEQEEEAHYLCAILNSRTARIWLGGFLLAAQIGTMFLEFTKIPLFDPNSSLHQEIAAISSQAHNERQGQRNIKELDESIEIRLDRLVRSILLNS
jgi:hypothetical protein